MIRPKSSIFYLLMPELNLILLILPAISSRKAFYGLDKGWK